MSLRDRVSAGLFWGGMNTLVQQLVGVVFGIVLARLLSQADYGMMAMIGIFSLIATAVQNSGFTTAIANLDAPTSRDYNAVFWFNILVGCACYVLLFFLAPVIAAFYGNAALVPLCRYAFLSIVIAAAGTAQNAWLFKHLRARQQAAAAMTAVIISNVVGVAMAIAGMAYWSLATQGLVYVLVNTLMVWRYSSWRPTMRGISFAPIRGLWRFAYKVLLTTITTIVNNNVLNILLGRLLGAQQTGIYNQAYQWNYKASSVVQNMVSQVAQPMLVEVRSDGARQLHALRKLMRFTAFVAFPLMIGFAVVAKEFIVLALTDKWLASASLLQILCLAGAVAPLSVLLANAILTQGRSGIYLYITLALCVTQIATLVALAPQGLQTLVVAYTALNVVWLFVWFFFAHRLTAYHLLSWLRDVVPFALTAALCGLASLLLTRSLTALWLLLITKIAIFAVLYYGVMKVCRVQILADCEEYIMKKLRR